MNIRFEFSEKHSFRKEFYEVSEFKNFAKFMKACWDPELYHYFPVNCDANKLERYDSWLTVTDEDGNTLVNCCLDEFDDSQFIPYKTIDYSTPGYEVEMYISRPSIIGCTEIDEPFDKSKIKFCIYSMKGNEYIDGNTLFYDDKKVTLEHCDLEDMFDSTVRLYDKNGEQEISVDACGDEENQEVYEEVYEDYMECMIVSFNLYDPYSVAFSEDIIKKEDIKSTIENDDLYEDVFLSEDAVITVLNNNDEEIGDIKITDLEVAEDSILCDYGEVDDENVVIRKIHEHRKCHYKDSCDYGYHTYVEEDESPNIIINFVKEHLKTYRVKVLNGKSPYYLYKPEFCFNNMNDDYIEFHEDEWTENSCGEFYLRDENREYNPISLEDFEEEDEE